MAEKKKSKRLIQIAKELNVGIEHLIEHLQANNIEVEARPNTKVPPEGYTLLLEKFSSDKKVKEEWETRFRHKQDKEEEPQTPESPSVVVSEEPEKVPEKEEIPEEPKEKVTEPEEIIQPKEEEKTPEEVVELPKEPVEEKKEEQVKKEDILVEKTPEEEKEPEKESSEEPEKVAEKKGLKVVGNIDLDALNPKTKTSSKKKTKPSKPEKSTSPETLEPKEQPEDKKIAKEVEVVENQEGKADSLPESKEEKSKEDDNFIKTKVEKLASPKIVGKIELKEESKTERDKSSDENKKLEERRKKRRRRIRKLPIDAKTKTDTERHTKKKNKKNQRQEVSDEDVQKQVRETLAQLTNKGKKTSVKYRRKKREEKQNQIQEEFEQQAKEKAILKVTEFISANELAQLMEEVSVNQIIATCFELGKMVTINSRLDAEIIGIIAEEYGYEIQFISATESEDLDTYEDSEEDMIPRPPIVTVMGHVDHGKTSLLDFIRDTNVISGEAGGITQHIGAYSVTLDNGKKVTFLDTPGHEAFTAMRARGAQVTDIAIIIISADDSIMPQTEEAISHAKAADVPIVFAINKIDKAGADPERIKAELAQRGYQVEEWGGKYQSADISAKKGLNIEDLLDRVILEAELLELKANPDRPAKGTVIEAQLDKGRGFLSTILVQTGTLKIGDVVLAGAYSGKVKAMFDERNHRVKAAGPSIPVQILGLDGAPEAGESFYVMENDKSAREIANKNKRIRREQLFRTNKHITLDEIGRRLQLGNFQEINIIIKGDVIGSVEAIADSLVKLGNEEIQVKIIHKGVGQISEADVSLAAASDAIIIGFQVRPALKAKKMAEAEEIDIRLYSVIYQAIEEMKAAMEGMLSPEIKEEITATVEIREVFKVSKVGKVAGCFVLDGKIARDDEIRLIRDGIVKYEGELGSLRRFKDDVKEVVSGMECGLNIENFNDIKVGDIVESYRRIEIEKTL